MSYQVTTAQVNQFNANVFHLAQQKGSKLRGLVRIVRQKSEKQFFDIIGKVAAQRKIGRHSKITYSDTPHSRRMISLQDWYYADMVDEEDKLRMIQSPESDYAKAAMMSLGRKMDDLIVTGALGTSYSGKEGSTAVVLPDAQKICAFDGTSLVGAKLNVKTLRAVKKLFNKKESGESELTFVLGAEQLDSLLGETEVTSSDYANVKALVQGDIDSFMGFKFIRIDEDLIPVTAAATSCLSTNGILNGVTGGGSDATVPLGSRRCFAFQKEGVLLSLAQDMTTKMTEMPEYHYNTQVYAKMGVGTTRLEDTRVVEVICIE